MGEQLSQTGKSDMLLVDVGSTVIKVAIASKDGLLEHQDFYDRDYEARIVDQVQQILSGCSVATDTSDIIICSSANGGLRVGIISLSGSYSGSVIRNQALLSGANPVYVDDLRSARPNTDKVDVLVVGGGIDEPDHRPLLGLLEDFDPSGYRYGSLVYAGNKYFADFFRKRFPQARIVANPMATGLASFDDSIFVALRDAYLDDLVYKEGISELAAMYRGTVFPTPQVVNLGYQKCLAEQTFPAMNGASMLIDIGGATTDFHFTTEVIRVDSEKRPARGSSVARYVFPDLGVFTSRDSTLRQLRQNSRTYEFLTVILDSDVSEYYRLLREGELEPPTDLIAYACVFLGLDRFVRGSSPGLPTADLVKLNNIAFTGGAAQLLDPVRTAAIMSMFLAVPVTDQFVFMDSDYEIWVRGAVCHSHVKRRHVEPKNVATAT